MEPTAKYLKTLLSYYEEEVMGEGYFYALAEHFEESAKLILLAKIERRAADSIRPLLEKYGLNPSDESLLKLQGKAYVERHRTYTWSEFMKYIIDRYPDYLEEFAALERMAPDEDLYALTILTDHEVAVIDFAKKEIANDPNSSAPLHHYLR
ncbi:MAG: hypothetical protein OEQ39_04025 [Gammaproteobacteria bacterium]|nr:hypothetical protein [Gammaproteobacteria bacterium]MDH3466812.1 hypothetical protein [Gammaproteobacteria bacterium]